MSAFDRPGTNMRLRNWIVFQVMATSDLAIALISNYFNGDPGYNPLYQIAYQDSTSLANEYENIFVT